MKNRLEELKKTSSDPKLTVIFEEMVRLESILEDLRGVELYRKNPNNPAQVKVNPAFFAYHKTLSAYKEIVRVLLNNCDTAEEDSPLRAYLKSIQEREEYTE